MLYSHMQDTRAYKMDMMKTLGHILECNTAFTPENLAVYKQRTNELRQLYLPVFRRSRRT